MVCLWSAKKNTTLGFSLLYIKWTISTFSLSFPLLFSLFFLQPLPLLYPPYSFWSSFPDCVPLFCKMKYGWEGIYDNLLLRDCRKTQRGSTMLYLWHFALCNLWVIVPIISYQNSIFTTKFQDTLPPRCIQKCGLLNLWPHLKVMSLGPTYEFHLHPVRS